MTKYIITLTDRSYYSELDLRKERLGKLDELSYFKINEEGEVVSKETTATYFKISSSIRALNLFLNDKMSINTSGAFRGNFISKDNFSKFIKFAKKNGKVVELENLDTSFLSVLESFDLEQKGIVSKITELENSFTSINYLDSKGRFKKINYRNIIIFQKSSSYSDTVTYISDDNTNITHVVMGSCNSDIRLKEEFINYYSYYHLGGDEGFSILKANKKGREQYLILMNQLTELNARREKVVREYELSLLK
jgi:hypothetical protein